MWEQEKRRSTGGKKGRDFDDDEDNDSGWGRVPG